MAKMHATGDVAAGTSVLTDTLEPLGGVTSYGVLRLLEISLLARAVPALEVALFTLGADGDNDAIVELTSPGYRRERVTFLVADDLSLTNALDIVVGPVVGLTPYYGAGIMDGKGIWWFDDNVSGVITDGNTLTFAAGSIVLAANV